MKRIVIVSALLLLLLRKGKASTTSDSGNNSAAFSPVLEYSVIRNDSQGSGVYGASRDGGDRTHQGIDLLVTKGDAIYSPISGRATASRPYANDTRFQGIRIDGTGVFSGYQVKIFYFLPYPGLVGTDVIKGQYLGDAQAISDKYNKQMKDHIHVELRLNGVVIDPTPYFV